MGAVKKYSGRVTAANPADSLLRKWRPEFMARINRYVTHASSSDEKCISLIMMIQNFLLILQKYGTYSELGILFVRFPKIQQALKLRPWQHEFTEDSLLFLRFFTKSASQD
jgi:hypothetical protein